MGRSKNYKKWQKIYIDHKDGMTWNEIVEKNKTSKRTISKAINFYSILERGNLNEIENLSKKFGLNKEKIIELHENFRRFYSKKLKLGDEEIEAKQNQYLIKIQNIIKMLESTNNLTRMRLILILLIYNELSLTSLSKKLGISKSTASRHLKALIKTNVIKIRKQKVRASRKKQYYSIIPNLLQIMRLSSFELRRILPEKALEARLLDLKSDKLILRTIKNFMNEILLYYEDLQEHIERDSPTSHHDIEKTFSTENVCRYYFWMFNKKQFEVFRTKYLEFLKDLLKEMEKYQNNNNEVKSEINLYFVWHLMVPVKKIYDNIFNQQK